MSGLEKFLHRTSNRLPLLVDAALAHVQFESAHPFLDGSGRIGRLLITLLLCERGVLKAPTLYLSLYFKERRDEYYSLLQDVRLKGAWENWIDFFLTGISSTADKACNMAFAIRQIFDVDRRRIQSLPRNGSLIQLHAFLERNPIATLTRIASQTGLAINTVGSAMNKLQQMGIVNELTGKKRDRIFVYASYMQILDQGTVP